MSIIHIHTFGTVCESHTLIVIRWCSPLDAWKVLNFLLLRGQHFENCSGIYKFDKISSYQIWYFVTISVVSLYHLLTHSHSNSCHIYRIVFSHFDCFFFILDQFTNPQCDNIENYCKYGYKRSQSVDMMFLTLNPGHICRLFSYAIWIAKQFWCTSLNYNPILHCFDEKLW